jgi:hypothetical protein
MTALIVFLTGVLVYLALWLIFIIPVFLLSFWFCARVLRKAGFSIWWSVFVFFPPALVVLIWLMAFIDWPARGPAVVVYRGPPRR